MENNNVSLPVLFSFQQSEFTSDDYDDLELCKLAAEYEDYKKIYSYNSKTQEDLHTNDCNKKGLCTPRDYSDVAQCGINWDDDDWDDESLLAVHVQHDSHNNEGSIMPAKQHKWTLEAFQGNKIGARHSLGTLDNCSKKLTSDDGVTNISTTPRDQVDGNLEVSYSGKNERKTCESCGFSLEKCSCDNKFVGTSDEEVSDLLNEDPVSDLELSFAADEVESTAYQ